MPKQRVFSWSTAAAYPSRLHVGNHALLDSANSDLGVLKGFNTNVTGTGLPFSQTAYNGMSTLTGSAAVPGPGFNRLVLTWDTFEPTTQGVFDGITTATSAATAGSAFDKLDVSIQRAHAAGRYVQLDVHLLDAGSSNGRVPAWARTGTLPAGSGNSFTWFCTNGQGFVQTLANRYGNPATSPIGAACMAVIGLCPNEPSGTTQDELMDGHETFVPWYRSIVSSWPIWASPFSYGGGTPYPSGADAVDLARLLALDSNNVGIILDYRTYMVAAGAESPDGYQPNGAIAPVQQVSEGANFHGWGTEYTYANTLASRQALERHLAPLVHLRDQNSRIALAMTEFGSDFANNSAHDAWIKDNIDRFRASGVVLESWWQFGEDLVDFNSGSTATGSTTRPGISGSSWMGNSSPRLDPQNPVPGSSAPSFAAWGTVGVTPNTAASPMTATGQTLPSGTVDGSGLVMYVYFNTGATTSGQSITAPDGWTELADLPHLVNGNMMRVYVRKAGASEPAPASPTFTGATVGTSGGVAQIIVGRLTGSNFNVLPNFPSAGLSGGNGITGSQNIGAITGFTPNANNALVWVFGGKKDDWTSVATLSGDSLTWTEQFELSTLSGGDCGMVLCTAPITGAPVAIANKTFTVTGGAAANGLGIMGAFKP